MICCIYYGHILINMLSVELNMTLVSSLIGVKSSKCDDIRVAHAQCTRVFCDSFEYYKKEEEKKAAAAATTTTANRS